MTDGVTLTIDMAEVEKAAADMTDRLQTTFILQKVADIVTESVRYNFVVGGRPTAWKPLAFRNGKPLRDKGRLVNSINGRVVGDKAVVGTNVLYAGTHNFGAKKGSFGKRSVTVKAHTRKRRGTTSSVRSHSRKQSLPWGDIPKREFMLLQVPADILEIERLLVKLAEG